MEEAGREKREKKWKYEEVKVEERKKRRDTMFAEDAKRGVKKGGEMRRWKRTVRKKGR